MGIGDQRAKEPGAPQGQPIDRAAIQTRLEEARIGGVLASEIEIDEIDPVVVVARLEQRRR